MNSAMPRNHASSATLPVSGSNSGVSPSIIASPAKPPPTTRATPARATSLLDEPAPSTRPSVIGLMIAPAWIAL